MTIIPTFSYYCSSNSSDIFFLSVGIGFFISVLINVNTKKIKIKTIYNGNRFGIIFAFSILILGLLLALLNNGIPSLLALDFSQVYSVRSEYISSGSLEYLKSWGIYAIIPFCISFSVKKRKKVLLFISILIPFFHFLSSGAKYTAFLIPFIFFIYFTQKKKYFPLFMVKVFLMILFLSFILIYFDLNFFVHYLYTRPLLIPAWLSFEYFNFFNNNNLLLLSENFPTLIKSPYQYPAPLLIGESLFPNGGGTWANTNIYGDSYANFGPLGPILYSIIFGLIIFLCDSIAKNNKILTTTLSASAMTVCSASLLTVLASRGLFVSIFFCWLMCEINKSEKIINRS